MPVEKLEDDNYIIQLVNSLLIEALSCDASDIHLEPMEDTLRIRFRIDGVLQEKHRFSPAATPLIISRLKLLAGMDITEKRLPQDGNMYFQWDGRDVNIRTSTVPTIYGEKMAIRLLSLDKVVMPLNYLGFNAHNWEKYKHFLQTSFGMLLVTGPTGCGKTTTLYSTLSFLSSNEVNILTVEDPIEYRLKGINQIQINNKINLTFASALRAVLRQDPNIVMVGEIRDSETAEIAIRAALTGHLVFSTLHTNDAPRAISRLIDIGVEPYLLNSSLVGVISQRLIRLNCKNCMENYTPARDELTYYQYVRGDNNKKFVKGMGCDECGGTGYKGRSAIHEVMPVDENICSLIYSSGDAESIRQYTLNLGMKSLIMDGFERAEKGITTLEEVIHKAYCL